MKEGRKEEGRGVADHVFRLNKFCGLSVRIVEH